mgnify:CR=1 FL=1
MEKLMIMIRGFYILATIVLLNPEGIKAQKYECGCVNCQNPSTYKIVGTISNVLDTNQNLEEMGKWCAIKFPSECSSKNEKGQMINICDPIWDSMDTGACPPDTCR